MKMQKKTNLKDDSKKRKKSFFKKHNENSLSKSSYVECFNCGGKWHFASDFHTLKKKKKVMLVTWSDFELDDNNSKGSIESETNNNPVAFTTFLPHFLKLIVSLNQVILQETYNVLYHKSYELNVENTNLKKTLNIKNTFIEWLESKKNKII